MKKLLYINLDFKKYQNKAKAQIKGFKGLNVTTEVATMENEDEFCKFKVYKYVNNEFELIKEKKLATAYVVEQGNNSLISLFNRLIKTLKRNKMFKKEVINYFNENTYDYCYIRRIGFFVIFLRSMFKKLSLKSKVLYEIPTYPLDKYDSFLINFSQQIEVLYFNLFIKKYITLIPVILQNDIKLDKKMIPISNGIDSDKFSNVSLSIPKLDKKFKMVVIAHILSWHGYDRLIKSLAKYKGKYQIEVDIYGDINEEVKKLDKLIEQYDLKKNVTFKGETELEEMLNNISKYHIAIGSLGFHRRNGKYDTSIKNKEYCAMGLPMVCAAKDLSFNDDFKYVYMVSADDNEFDITKIIEWYKNISKKDYKKEMTIYAKENLDYSGIYRELFKKLSSNDES